MNLTSSELAVLRVVRGNANDIYLFDIRCVPAEFLNTEFKSLKDNSFVAIRSGMVYQITPKGLAALREADLSDDASKQTAQQEACNRTAESCKKTLVVVWNGLLWLVGAVLSAFIAQAVAKYFH